jgi:NTP pyrophosphatase (non-canonical NTP hydrolase)
MLTFRDLQDNQRPWLEYNFPQLSTHPYWPLLGALEELGELAHAHLKMEQTIRPDEHILRSKARDAIGDIVIFLSAYCTAMGWDFNVIIQTVWAEVFQRDWVQYPLTGRPSK